MPGLVKSMVRVLLIQVLGRLLSFILFDVTIEGKENLPNGDQRPLIVIANHFSWFDAPILAIHLPFQPAFLVATESLRTWWVRAFIIYSTEFPSGAARLIATPFAFRWRDSSAG